MGDLVSPHGLAKVLKLKCPLLSNDPGKVDSNFFCYAAMVLIPHIGFLCYSNWDQILLYGRWLKARMNICTVLWRFVNFCCLSQSEVSTDNRKVSTFFPFQHVHCRCCYRSYLDRFLNYYKTPINQLCSRYNTKSLFS